MDYEKFKKEFLKNDKVREEFEKHDNLAFEVAKILIAARVAKKMTQAQLAKKMKTKQSGIARAESGDRLPSLSFLKKLAGVYGTDLIPPKFKCMEGAVSLTNTTENILSGRNSSNVTLDDILYKNFTTKNLLSKV